MCWGKTLDPLYESVKATLTSNGANGRILDDEQAIEEFKDDQIRY